MTRAKTMRYDQDRLDYDRNVRPGLEAGFWRGFTWALVGEMIVLLLVLAAVCGGAALGRWVWP